MTDLSAEAPHTRTESYPHKLAMVVLDFAMREYLEASGYYRRIGAQTSSEIYGGSRSLIYYQMLGRTSTLKEMVKNRKDFATRHDGEASDEGGALLRIVGYKLKAVPILGRRIEEKIRRDDAKMAATNFVYPEGYDRVVGEPEDLRSYLHNAQSKG